MDSGEIREIKIKRTEQLVNATKRLITLGILDGENYTLDVHITSELVDYYCRELINIKEWYSVKEKANTAKIAGIMASAIVRYRPWLPINGKIDSKNKYHGNAIIAIYHGLILCAVEDHDVVKRFMSSSEFDKWFELFQYILRNRHITPDLLILVFETIRTFM